jgi:hypothetical protein
LLATTSVLPDVFVAATSRYQRRLARRGCCGFVQQEQGRVAKDGQGELQTLFHAAAEVAHGLFQVSLSR